MSIDYEKLERFYALRRADGAPIGDYQWVEATDSDDWAWVEDYEPSEVGEVKMVEMIVRPIARRWFGVHTFEPCDDAPDECDRCFEARVSPAHRTAHREAP